MLLVLGPHIENHCSFLFLIVYEFPGSSQVLRFFWSEIFILPSFFFVFIDFREEEESKISMWEEPSVVSVHAPTGDQT